MSVSVTVAGTSYTIPQVGDVSWGPQVTAWIQAISAVTLQTTGGTFTLTSDLNFGANFGLISKYFTSVSSNSAQSGIVRLANGDGIGFRNSGNTADILLKADADGFLQYNNIDLANLSSAQTLTNKTLAAGSNTITGITNSNLSGAAAIANANLASMATLTIKGNNTGGGSTPIDLTVSQVNTMLGSLSNPMTTLGDTIYGGASGAVTRLAGDTSNTRKFLRSLSSSSVAMAPVWDTIQASDVPTLNQNTSGNATTATTSTNIAGGAGGSIPYQSAANTTALLANGSSGQVVQSAGGTSAPTWAALPGNSTALKPLTISFLTATGTQTGWLFTISTSTTCAVGDTYTNNSHTYTVQGALTAQSGQVLFMSGTGATSGTTLTRATGSGTSSVTFSTTVATATYTLPSGPSPLYLKFKMVGGGGGGAGSSGAGNNNGSAGGAGGATFFGANILTASGGSGGAGSSAPSGGAGGGATIGLGASGVVLSGGSGGNGATTAVANVSTDGGAGGVSAFGGSAPAGQGNDSPGAAAAANTGSGGSGAAALQSSASTNNGGGGGGAGGYIEAIITSPSSSYVYLVGAAGSAGTNGTNGASGGAGATGLILIEEHYQ